MANIIYWMMYRVCCDNMWGPQDMDKEADVDRMVTEVYEVTENEYLVEIYHTDDNLITPY